MKKWMVFWLTCICTLLCCATAIAAQHVVDNAELFTSDEITQMESTISQIGDTWDIDTLILTTNDTGGLPAREYGAHYFLDGDFGYGNTKDGIVFVIDMGNRDAQMVTHGKAIDIFTDFYIGVIWDEVSPYLSDEEYYDAMTLFLQDVEHYCTEYQKYLANPDTYVSEYERVPKHKEQSKTSRCIFMLAALVISLLIAGISVFLMRASHNNVKPFTDGQAYLKNNGVRMRINQDTFVSTHTTRTEIPKNHRSGGGSSTFSSSGSTFGGGGGKF